MNAADNRDAFLALVFLAGLVLAAVISTGWFLWWLLA